MKKFIKYAASIALVLMLIAFAALLAFVTLIDPNRFKPLLVEQAKKYTQHEVRIDGDLSWKIFPEVAIKVGHMVVLNPPGASVKNLLEIGKVDVGVKLRPLFEGRLEITGLDMTAISANLDGYSFKNAEVHSKNIKPNAYFPLALQFDFQDQNTLFAPQVELTTEVLFNQGRQQYFFRNLKALVLLQQDKEKLKLKLSGNLKVDAVAETLLWNDLSAHLAKIDMKGKLSIAKIFTKPVTAAHLSSSPFDLKAALTALGQNTASIQVAKNARADFDYATTEKGGLLKGHVTIETLTVNHVQLTKLSAEPHFQGGVLDVGGLTADFYRGQLLSKIKIDFKGQQPRLETTTNLKGIDVAALLHDLANKNTSFSLMGTGDLNLQLNSILGASQNFVRNMNGSGRFAISKGTIQGMDVDNLIDTAYALIKNQTRSSIDTNQTHFNTLTGTVLIRGGVLQNNDLLLDGSHFATKGEGGIDLVNQRINYLLQTIIKKKSLKQEDDLDNLYGIAVPISINGNLESPAIRLDSSRLLKAVAIMQLERSKQSVKKKLQEQIKQNVPGPTGDLLQMLINN